MLYANLHKRNRSMLKDPVLEDVELLSMHPGKIEIPRGVKYGEFFSARISDGREAWVKVSDLIDPI